MSAPTHAGLPGEVPPLHGEDLELVRNALAGDRGAGEDLLERLLCVPRLLMARNLQSGQQLEERELEGLVKESLWALWRQLPAYDGAPSLEVWADHFCLAPLLRRLEAGPAAGRPRPGPVAGWREQAGLHEALDALAGRRAGGARLLRLRHFTGLADEELNRRLRLPPGATRALYYRGLRALQAVLGGGTGQRGAAQHPALHEDLLPTLLAEAADPRHALEGSALAECPECAREVDAALALADELERAGRDALAAAALAESVHSAPGEELVAAALDPLLAPAAEERRRVPWLGLALAVAAAGLLVAVFVFDPWGTPEEAFGQTRFGGGTILLEHPVGAVDAWGTFVWTSEVPAEGWFTVRVLDAEGALVAESPQLRATLWTADGEQVKDWPERLLWEVRRYDSASVHLDTAFGEAWLAP